jgi:hypothetical protein
MSAFQSLNSTSSSASGDQALRNACVAFEEAMKTKLADAYEAADRLTGDHKEVVLAAVELTAALMLSMAELGESIESDSSVGTFINTVLDFVLSKNAVAIATYSVQSELTKVFDNKQDPSLVRLRDELTKKLEKRDEAADEKAHLTEAKEILKKLDAEHQAKVEDLLSVAKYGHTVRKAQDNNKVTFSDVTDFRKQIEIDFNKHHINNAAEDSAVPKSRSKSLFVTASYTPGSPSEGDQKVHDNPSDDDSTASRPSRGFFCCAAFVRKNRRKGKRL